MRSILIVAACALSAFPLVAQQQGVVTGRVTDGVAPLDAVQVHIPASGLGVLTGSEGRFRLAAVPAGVHTLRVQRLGFRTIDRQIEVVAGETLELNFELQMSVLSLDEMVVTATGEQRSREIGTSLARVTAREIEVAPVRNTQDLLTGRVPGATVLQNSGQPGAGGTILLRGNNSISQGNNPLIYIDGVRVYGGSTPSSFQGGQPMNPLNDISADDIERVEVIKGAAATTLYGTEASGGVIQVFTKRGRPGESRWSAEVTTGFNNLGHLGSSADPTGMWIKECRGANNVGYDGRVFEDVDCPASGSWAENGLIQRYAISVAGGSDAVTYFLSGKLDEEEGVIFGGKGTSGRGLTGNFGFEPTEALSISLSSSLTRREVEWLPSGNNGDSFVLNVSRGFGSNFGGATGCVNPDAVCVANGEILGLESTTLGTHFITGITARHRYNEYVTNRFTLGYDYNISEMQSVHEFGYSRNPPGDISVRMWRQSLMSMDYVGNLAIDVSDTWSSSSSWGGQLFATDGRTLTVTGDEFSGPGSPTLTSAARRGVTQDSRQRVTNAGFFLEETLAWRDRMFLTGGVRIDGNSAFGENFGLQTYPKISASYVVSDEAFWSVGDWWTSLKLRAAMGESGKAPGAFDAVRTWNPIAADDGSPGFTPGQIGNENLGPERTREVEAGFEASFFGGGIGVDFTYYDARTFDALIPVTSPPSQGFASSQLENVGELVNRGIELRVDFDILRRSGFDWRGRVDYATVSSEAIDLGGQEITVQTFGRTAIKEGYPVPGIFGLKLLNPNEFADPEWEEDAFVGSLYPTKSISINSNMTLFERFVVDAVGEFKRGGHMINGNAYQNGGRGAWFPCYATQQKEVLRRAGDESAMSDVTALERARCALTGGPVARSYDSWIESTDFFKLRSISVTYTLPEAWVPRVERATLQIAGRNLLTVTDYTGSDPELDDYPGSLARRDYYVLPPYRTFQASLRFTF